MYLVKILIVVLCLLALYLAIKVGKLILKIVFCLVGLALLLVAVWWLLFRH